MIPEDWTPPFTREAYRERPAAPAPKPACPVERSGARRPRQRRRVVPLKLLLRKETELDQRERELNRREFVLRLVAYFLGFIGLLACLCAGAVYRSLRR